MKKIIVIITIIIILALAGFFLAQMFDQDYDAREPVGEEQQEEPQENTEEQVSQTEAVIATSVEGRDIVAHYYGQGDKEILLVAGIHGGYEWNTVFLAEELMDYLDENPEVVPENLKVTIVPNLNPDGFYKVAPESGDLSVDDISEDREELIASRFNANNVDLNRNFDCEWQAEGTWQSRDVDGGSEPFSEPESSGLKKYIEENSPEAVVMYYSAANGVFASNCRQGVLDETKDILNAYADASGYPAFEDFDFYEVTGDATNWMAKVNIPAISVLLTNHQSTEFNKNKAGLEALLEYYSK